MPITSVPGYSNYPDFSQNNNSGPMNPQQIHKSFYDQLNSKDDEDEDEDEEGGD
jgi:hypothetical protein